MTGYIKLPTNDYPLTITPAESDAINSISWKVRHQSRQAGWPECEIGTMIALCHSELSEALEGVRKNLMDDHLPHRKMVEVELADAVIRIFDLAMKLELDLGGAIAEKHEYNATREDHKKEARAQAGGKQF